MDLCYYFSLSLSNTLTSWYFSPLCFKTTDAFCFIICAYCSSKHVIVLVLCFLTFYTLETIVIVDLKNLFYCLTIKCLFYCKWHVFRQWPLSPSLQSQVSKLPWCRKPAGCLERQLRCYLDPYVFIERNSRYTDLSVLAVVLHTVCIVILDISSLFYVFLNVFLPLSWLFLRLIFFSTLLSRLFMLVFFIFIFIFLLRA